MNLIQIDSKYSEIKEELKGEGNIEKLKKLINELKSINKKGLDKEREEINKGLYNMFDELFLKCNGNFKSLKESRDSLNKACEDSYNRSIKEMGITESKEVEDFKKKVYKIISEVFYNDEYGKYKLSQFYNIVSFFTENRKEKELFKLPVNIENLFHVIGFIDMTLLYLYKNYPKDAIEIIEGCMKNSKVKFKFD